MSTYADIPPASFYAGSTLLFDFSDADFPAGSSWQLNWYLKGDDQFTWAWATEVAANGDDFRTTVSAATTAAIGAGTYRLAGVVTKSGEVHTIFNRQVSVKADPSVVSGSYDERSFAKKALDYIEAVLLGVAQREEASYTIGGGPVSQSIEVASRKELMEMRNRFKAEYEAELRAAARERGEGTGARIRTRFV